MTRVVRVPILPLGMVNAHLVLGRRGAILVDAGLPGTEAAVAAALKDHGLGWRDLQLIVITHAHVDHAGNAARLRRLSGAPVCAHRGDLDHYTQRRPMTLCATGLFGRLFHRTGLIQRAYEPFEPDVLVDGRQPVDLTPYGIDGEVLPTPGHTCGSLSVVLADGRALVGDLVASGVLLGGIVRSGHPKRPPFEDDPAQVGDTLRRLAASGATTFYLGHGGPLPQAEVLRHVQRLQHAAATRA